MAGHTTTSVNRVQKVQDGVGLFRKKQRLAQQPNPPRLPQQPNTIKAGAVVPKVKSSVAPHLTPKAQEMEKQEAGHSMVNFFFSTNSDGATKRTIHNKIEDTFERGKRGKSLVQIANKKAQVKKDQPSQRYPPLHVVSSSFVSSDVRHPQKFEGLKENKDQEFHSQQEAGSGNPFKSCSRRDQDSKHVAPSHAEKKVDKTAPVFLQSKKENFPPRSGQQTGKRHTGPRYGACAPNRDRARRNIATPPSKRARSEEAVDLTADSDDEDAGASHTPSRKDLLDLTGSSSTGVDSSDLCLESDSIDVESSGSEDQSQDCEFLRAWVGSDEAFAAICRRDGDAEKSEISTVKAEGMGSFCLDTMTLQCLGRSTWLNDEVINAYMALLSLRSAQRNQTEMSDDDNAQDGDSAGPRCAFFSSFFYALLRNAKGGYSHDNVKRWARKKDLAACDRIFFPINVSNSHWCLAVVFPREKCIRYFDSLGGRNSNCLDLLERYMQDEGELRDEEMLRGEWKKENVGPPEVPKQQDGSSCGVFLCAFADCLSAGKDPSGFKQLNIPQMRRAIRSFLERCRM